MTQNRHVVALLVVFGLLISTTRVAGQQDGQFTQFMFNRLFYTPGFAGSEGGPCLSLIYRKQWIGLEGAPEAQMVSFNTPLFQQRVGLGINLYRTAIGITRNVTAEMAYSYRIPLGRGYLGVGLSGSIRYFTEDYGDERVKGTQDINLDPGVPVGLQSKYLPNFGAGLYYQAKNLYVGAGVPRLVEGNIDFGNGSDRPSTEIRHYYAMGGYRITLNNFLALHPQLLLKYVGDAPFDADLHVALEMKNQFHAGLTYRFGGDRDPGLGESLDLIIGFRIRQHFLLSVGYDIALSDIRDYQNGTFEALLRFCFGKGEASEIDNPRFFQ